MVFTSKQISVSIAQKHSKWVLMSSLPVCLLKHPCKQCILSLKYQFYRFFLYSVFIISNPVIFLQIFNFTLITCHRIIKRCFGMWQPYVQSFFKRQTWEGLYVFFCLKKENPGILKHEKCNYSKASRNNMLRTTSA